jgi:hypothetical protein
MQLTTEQQFQIAAFKMQVQQMSPEQVKQQLVAHYEQMLKKDTEYLQKIGNAWGMV